MSNPQSISIIGAGAWGTTLSILLSENGHEVKLWIFEEDLCSEVKKTRENSRYLPGFSIPVKIDLTCDLKEAMENSSLIIFAVPSQHLRKVAKLASQYISKNHLVLSVTKGLEEETLKRMSEVLLEEIKDMDYNKLAVLSGPNLSKEIAKGFPAAAVIASTSKNTAKSIQDIFMMERFRAYTSSDVIGVEIGGMLKNVIAIASGVADGLGFGDNAKAALMVRGIVEITRFGEKMGANPSTFSGLSGIGDLIATCSSKLSRNHLVGEEIAKGKKLDEILSSMKAVAEGVPTAKAAHFLSKKLKVEMPITEQVYQVLFENKDPYKAITDLMIRSPKEE